MVYRKVKIPWNKGGGTYSAESLLKMSKSQKERFRMMPTPNKGIPHTAETKRKISVAKLGKSLVFTLERKLERNRKISEARRGKSRSEYVCHLLSERGKLLFSDPVKKEVQLNKMRRGLKVRPTTPEKYFMQLCQDYKLPFRYVGDGQFWLAGKNPDFLNVNGGKQVVEILGSYWHTEEEIQERIKLFAEYGFECIPIWDKELKDKELVLNKLGVAA